MTSLARVRNRRLGAVVVVVGLLAGCGPPPEPQPGLAAAFPGRPFEPRLVGFAHAPCPPDDGSALLAPVRCTPVPDPSSPDFGALRRAERQLREASRRDASPPALHAEAVRELVFAEEAEQVDAAVRALEELTHASPSAPRWSDLAAAYLVRAVYRGDPADLLTALDAADRALALEPELPEAVFNRALLLTRLSLWDEAREGFQISAKLEPGTPWSAEASDRSAALRGPTDARAKLDAAVRAGPQELARTVEDLRQETRLYVQEALLPAWGEAYPGGDAEVHLRKAAALAEALAAAGGDRTAAEGVAAVRAAEGDEARLAALARGHRAYGVGFQRYENDDVDGAERSFREARRELEAGGSGHALWARFYLAVCDHGRFLYDKVDAELASLAQEIDRERYPALLGRVLWVRGLTFGVRNRLAEAVRLHRAARELFVDAGEIGNIAVVDHLLAENLQNLGETRRAWGHRYSALRRLDRVGRLNYRLNILYNLADVSQRRGLPRVALYFHDERVRLAEAAGTDVDASEAFLRRAQVLAELGRTGDAFEDLERAEHRAFEVGHEEYRERLLADILLHRGLIFLDAEPRAAIAALSEALRLYERWDYRHRIPELYHARALAYAARGDRERAEADLEAGVEEYERERQNVAEEDVREMYFHRARPLIDDMVSLHLADARPEKALGTAERSRGRLLLDRLGGGFETPDTEEMQARLPKGRGIVFYALLEGDRLISWFIDSEHLEVKERRFTAEDRALLDSVRGSDADAAQMALGRLYDVLLAPHAASIADRTSLVFVPDQDLFRVPFAALWDADDGSYLIQRAEVVVAPSITYHLAAAARQAQFDEPPRRLLAVADPEIDELQFPRLPKLLGARREVDEIASLYPEAMVLEGHDATKQLFLELAPEYETIHVASHALANPDAPWQSALILSPDPSTETSGALFAWEVSKHSFPRVRLIVLSACGTAVGGRELQGPASLVRPFLAGGVPSVLATLWKTDDEASVEFLVKLHRRVASGELPAAALRGVVLEALSAGKRPLPRDWAVFELFGA